MKKKVILEIFLLLLIIIISFVIFKYYFSTNETKIVIDKTVIKKSDNKPELNKETASVIKNINYTFVDDDENNYKIFAEFGKISVEQPDIIKMTNVKAFAYLKDTKPIKIVSNFADYNKTTHQTNFFKDVKLNYLDHNARSENLDLLLMKNIIYMYNNLIYKNNDIKLLADKLSFNLKTKNAKVFMNDKSKKVKVVKY
tara:strand:+ start:362 stop:955 length:594 start_codon:yes stop_codon:yes gene_type:complete